MLMRSLWEKLGSWKLKRLSAEDRAFVVNALIKKSLNDELSKEDLKFLMLLDNRLYKLQSQAAKAYASGEHPKHRLTNYHAFFIKHIQNNESVLDIGSGTGALAADIAHSVKGVYVTGIELEAKRVSEAKKNFESEHVTFVQGTCPGDLPKQKFDVIIMSNILEHLQNRIETLNQIICHNQPKRILIRVPQYDRDWRVPLKDEIGVDSRLSQSHYIEYRKEDFEQELNQANLLAVNTEFHWGEIWCVTEPK
jgi:SAM-dependent methyltransferase